MSKPNNSAVGPLGICIVGCGRFAGRHAQPAMERPDRIRLFFASRELRRAEEFASKYDADGAFGSYEEAAKDSRVDALLFCTPHLGHRQELEMAAANGKHVLMEKPISTNIADAEDMRKTSENAGIRFMIAENYRYVPSVMAAARLINEGAIGPLNTMSLRAAFYTRPTGWRLSKEMMGGGALIDGGIHKISVMRMLAGDPERVSAVVPPKVFPEMEGEEAVSLWATFPGGVVGSLDFTWAAPGESGISNCLLTGPDGHISFDFFGNFIELGSAGGKQTVVVGDYEQGMGGMLDAFVEYIQKGVEPATTAEVATRDLAVVLAAYESVATNGQPVLIKY